MQAEIIGIGTELLLGHLVNTNAAYLSRQLANLGVDVFFHTTVGDNRIRLLSTLKSALDRSDIVITTGGLGPTTDDITVETVSKLTKEKLIFNKIVSRRIEQHFARRKMKMPRNNLRQAYIPKGSRALKNDVGTAPGLIIKLGKKILVALPGPPRELIPMVKRDLVPYFKKLSPKAKWLIKSHLIKTTGLPESAVCPKVKDLLKIGPKTTVGIYAHLAEVHLKITTKQKNIKEANRAIAAVERKIRARLNNYIFGVDEETLEGKVGQLLSEKKLSVAVAESCTGGLIANRITESPGSSAYFRMGVVAYSNDAKTSLLGVPDELIQSHGAVSKQVAIAMAGSVKKIAGTHIGIGVTGIAGPTGGTNKKPVGTVLIASTSPIRHCQEPESSEGDEAICICKEYHFIGTRSEIKFQASQSALDMIRLKILNKT